MLTLRPPSAKRADVNDDRKDVVTRSIRSSAVAIAAGEPLLFKGDFGHTDVTIVEPR
jgi:hypothetical protein